MIEQITIMMKKIALILWLSFIGLLFMGAQDAIEAVSALEQIAHDQEAWSLEDADPYLYKTQICFTMNGWWYVVSYEAHLESFRYGDGVPDREAYLYRRKIGSTGWEIADPNPLFTHSMSYNHSLTYDQYALNSDQMGSSDVEVLTFGDEEIVVIFMGIKGKLQNNRYNFTELFIFYPRRVNANGSISFAHKNATLTYDKFFPLSRIEKNVFYGDGEYNVRIFANDNSVAFHYQHPTDGITFNGQRSK